MMTVKNIKNMLLKYNHLTVIPKIKKKNLIGLYDVLELYNKNKNNYDYHQYHFNNKIISVNNQQYDIITADIQQNIRIIASAGSGKTTTIICRIKYLIDHNIDPSKIILTTFTIDAAKNMEIKLQQLFGFLPKILIGTFDSISCRFYHKYFKQNYTIGIEEYGIELLKFLKSNEGYIIYNKYEYIFFDEFQDINEIQYDILMSFYKHNCKITVVGDDSQNIYSFRGSNIKFILDIDKDIENLQTYKILKNYRSTPEIIKLANESISFNNYQIKKEMEFVNKSINILPQVKYYKTIDDQNDDIIEQLSMLLKNGVYEDDIAIVSRINYPLKSIETQLEKYNSKNENKFKYIALISETNIDNKPKIKKDHITITTIHKAKGLEWKVVFIISCDDHFFPIKKDIKSIEEERRLFYVAITRAKQYLFLSFTGKKNNEQTYITRFIQEIPKDCYNFINKSQIYYNKTNEEINSYKTSIVELIEMLNVANISELRYNNILPKVTHKKIQVHEHHEKNTEIINNYWDADYGNFIDRYITRYIGYHNINSNGLYDRDAIRVLYACYINNFEYKIYNKNRDKFIKNIKNINKNTNQSNYIKILDIKLEKEEYNIIIINIILKIINRYIYCLDNGYNLDIGNIFICTKEILPEEFRQKIFESYKNYQNKNKQNKDILIDIYNVSLCGMINNDRPRFLYKNNVYPEFIKNNIFDDIDTYLQQNIINKDIKCKKFIYNKIYDIIGELDLRNITNNKIIDYKCSSSNDISLSWILQLLGYTALLKLENSDIIINEIEIYNPIKGIILNINITSWNKYDELIKYLWYIRDTKKYKY